MKDFYRPICVIDSSVMIKWVHPEENRDEALEIRERHFQKKIEIYVPNLTFYEILNYLSRKHPEQSLYIYSQILTFRMTEVHLSLKITARAIEITNKFPKTSFYDAVYHSIAIEQNGTFITADEKYYNQTKSLKHIQLLKDYK